MIKKNTSNWIMVAAPLTVFLFKRNYKCIKFSFWDLTVYDQYRYCNDWNSDSFRNVDDSEGEKKRIWEQVGKQLFWRKKSAKHSEQRCLQFYYEDSFFAFLGFFFLVTYIRETDFCVWWSTFLLLLVWCIFIRKLRPEGFLNYWSVKWDHPGNNSIEICFTAIEWEYCIFAKRFNGR